MYIIQMERRKEEATISYQMYKENSIQSQKSAPINEKKCSYSIWWLKRGIKKCPTNKKEDNNQTKPMKSLL